MIMYVSWLVVSILVSIVSGLCYRKVVGLDGYRYSEEDFGKSLVIIFVVGLLTFPNKVREYNTLIVSKNIVSASTQTGIEGSFTILGGSVGESVKYKIRESFGSGLYKDLLVRDVYLKEESSFKDTGLYQTFYKCRVKTTLSYLGFEKEYNYPLVYTWNLCNKVKSVLSVPVGTVVKNIKLD